MATSTPSRSASTRREWNNNIYKKKVRHQHRHRRGRLTKVFLDIHPFRSTLFIVIWSSPRRSLDAIILHQDPRVHQHLLSEIISHTIAYIVNIDKPQVQLQNTSCRSSPSGNSIRSSQGITQQHTDNTTTTTTLPTTTTTPQLPDQTSGRQHRASASTYWPSSIHSSKFTDVQDIGATLNEHAHNIELQLDSPDVINRKMSERLSRGAENTIFGHF